VTYPNPNDYTVELKNPIYDVSQIRIESAQIPNTQSLFHERNKKFTIVIDEPAPDAGNYTVELQERNIGNGTTLASHVLSRIQAEGITTIDTIDWRSTRDSLKFSNAATSYNFSLRFDTGINGWSSNVYGYTTPNQALGFTSEDHYSTNGVIDKEGRVDYIHGIKVFVIQIYCDAESLNQEIFTKTPFYTASIMNTSILEDNEKHVMSFNGNDYNVIHDFHRGSSKCMKNICIRWFYKENNKLIPYDFRGRDHSLKLSIKCSTDKLEGLPKVPIPEDEDDVEDKDVNIPEEIVENVYKWKTEYISIGLIIFVGIVLMFLMRRKPKLSE